MPVATTFTSWNAKEQIPFEQAKTEIQRMLENQQAQAQLDKIQQSYSTEINEAYFGVHAAKGDDQ